MTEQHAIPVLPYESLRPCLRTGHVILWRGGSFLSRAIRLFSEYSHASLVVRLFEEEGGRQRVYLVEALETGLELRHLSRRLAGYDGQARVWMPDVRPFQQAFLKTWAADRCADGVRYDYRSLFRNILCRVSCDAGRYFCSEFAWAGLVAAGVVRATPQAPRPGDIIPWAAEQGVGGDLIQFAPVPEAGEAAA
jgi:hypothetical protein